MQQTVRQIRKGKKTIPEGEREEEEEKSNMKSMSLLEQACKLYLY